MYHTYTEYPVFQSDDAYNPDRMYDLVAVVVHIGSSINRGHYISIVKSEDIWILFDDDIVDVSYQMSYNATKSVFRVSDQVQHKPACTVTEECKKLKMSN